MEGLDREHEVLLEPLDSLPGMPTLELVSHLDQAQNQAPVSLLPKLAAEANLDEQQPDLHLSDGVKQLLGCDPFKPLMEELSRLSRVDPQVAHQASEIVGLYGRSWDAYVAKVADYQRLQMANEELRTTNSYLCQQQMFMENRHASQETLLAYFGQAFDRIRESLVDLLKDWEDGSSGDSREGDGRGGEELS